MSLRDRLVRLEDARPPGCGTCRGWVLVRVVWPGEAAGGPDGRAGDRTRARRALAFFGVGALLLAASMLIDLTGFYDERRQRFDVPAYVDELLWAIEESVKLIGFGAILAGTGLELTGTCAQRASDSG